MRNSSPFFTAFLYFSTISGVVGGGNSGADLWVMPAPRNGNSAKEVPAVS